MRSFANSVLMTLLMVVDGTCNEAEKEKITGKLFPNFLYKCSLAAKSPLGVPTVSMILERALPRIAVGFATQLGTSGGNSSVGVGIMQYCQTLPTGTATGLQGIATPTITAMAYH
ncbi:hypothetical protein FOL46_006401 [Perkinsus olseni]|uniref:Uncharacterized protein n=1 Tax=Perkinsus olseni TaxID=32597 RepID=A0A7J6MQG3_PEROL|nr:hypothetical protein FOL46_006401 [Perkinsus olseni]